VRTVPTRRNGGSRTRTRRRQARWTRAPDAVVPRGRARRPRRASGASISVATPNHFGASLAPRSSGRARTRNQRYSPAASPSRQRASNGTPVLIDSVQPARTRSRSSGWTRSAQWDESSRRPSCPVNSDHREFAYCELPRTSATNMMSGNDSTSSRKRASLTDRRLSATCFIALSCALARYALSTRWPARFSAPASQAAMTLPSENSPTRATLLESSAVLLQSIAEATTAMPDRRCEEA